MRFLVERQSSFASLMYVSAKCLLMQAWQPLGSFRSNPVVASVKEIPQILVHQGFAGFFKKQIISIACES